MFPLEGVPKEMIEGSPLIPRRTPRGHLYDLLVGLMEFIDEP